MPQRPTKLLTVLAVLAGVSLPTMMAVAKPAAPIQNAAKAPVLPGFDLANLDRKVSPTEDFYQFAIGGWQTRNPIPPEYPRWGSFDQLADRNNQALKGILEAAAKNTKAKAGSVDQKIGDFYASFMDTAAIEAAGLKPLQGEFDRIAAIQDRTGLIDAFAHLQQTGIKVPFLFGSTIDFKDSTQVIGEAYQAGLGMPDRDYYTKDDARSKEQREAYVKHIAKMFELAGDTPEAAAKQAQIVMAFETTLAKASMTKVQQRDPSSVYHKMTLAQLSQTMPGFDWKAYFKAIGRPDLTSINIGQPEFFKALDKQLQDASLADWQTYLRWHVLHAHAAALPDAFVQEDFHFAQLFSGAKAILPRWKRAVKLTNTKLGEALGQAYVKTYFPPSSKARVGKMISNLTAALRDDLRTLDWMSPTTRKAATTKLSAIRVKIGYPDKWRDYSSLTITKGDFLPNLVRANVFETKRDLAKIGKPVDRNEWWMSPPTVNAYYDPTMNEIVFPAGILQPPFFNPQADDAVNYGGIGVVIGHEITHGFDDQGAQFDAKGNLRNWWTAEDKKRFDARAEQVAKQFDGFSVEKDVNVNGKLVVGESIADLGGLAIAYRALQMSMAGKPKPATIDGFTPEQRFFLGYAQVWAENARPEYARTLVATDPHPPSRFRVNGPLSNMEAFAKAFGAKKGDSMVCTDACKIW
jgi:putative endopeptidase